MVSAHAVHSVRGNERTGDADPQPIRTHVAFVDGPTTSVEFLVLSGRSDGIPFRVPLDIPDPYPGTSDAVAQSTSLWVTD